MVLAGSGL